MARDDLVQRRREKEQQARDEESRAWDAVLEIASDMLGLCPVCDVIGYIAECEDCGQRMCEACFGRHELHPCG